MTKLRFLLMPVVVVSFVLAAASGFAQGSLKEQATGTWSLVSFDIIAADGSKKPVFSPKPKGTLFLAANGRYAMMIVDPERPKKWLGEVTGGCFGRGTSVGCKRVGRSIW